MKKKMTLCLSILILIFISTLSVQAVELKDVPQDHWAYTSVKQLIEKGYLSLYEDGTFSGNNKVSRYELAVLVASILEELQIGQVQATDQDMDTLRKLSLEFRDELVQLARQQEIFTEEIREIKATNMIQNEDISKVIDNILQLKKMQDEINSLNNKINLLEEEIKQTDQYTKNLREQLSENLFKDIKDQQAVSSTRIHTLQLQVNEFEDKMTARDKEVEQLKEQNEKYKIYLGIVALLAILPL